MSPRAGIGRVQKISPKPGLDPRTVQPYQITISTELSRPIFGFSFRLNLASCFILCVINNYDTQDTHRGRRTYMHLKLYTSSTFRYDVTIIKGMHI
jgi:hypothetical protein